MDDIALAFNALSVALAMDGNPFEIIGPEATNIVSGHLFSLDKPCPARMWWKLPHDHAAIARALRVDRSEFLTWYALAPFRYIKRGDRHLILAAYPCPRTFAPIDMDWLGIETVLAWEPTTGRVTNLTDDRPQMFGPLTETDNTIYADPRAFFTGWMRKRAWYVMARLEASKSPWSAKPAEKDVLPGALMIGEAEDIHWPIPLMPKRINAVGIDPKRLNRAILKSAAVPMCVGNDVARAA